MPKQKFEMPDGEIIEKDMPVWKTPWNHDTNFESDRTALFCADDSLTKQEFKEETDINNILDRFMRNNEPPPIPLPEHFGDTTVNETYHQMQNRLAEASAMFYRLPADSRAEHLNDPTRWADAVVKAVENNDVERLARLGIDATRKPQAAEGPPPAPVSTPATPAAPTPPAGPNTGGTP